MFVILKIFIVIVNLTRIVESHRIDATIRNFIVDASSSLFSPSTVTALLCVNDEESFDFSRQMSRDRVIHDIWKSFEGSRISSMKLHHQNLIVLDLDCPGAFDVLIKASQSRKFIAPAKWLLLQDLRNINYLKNTTINIDNLIKNADISRIKENFRDFEIFPDSEVILGRRIHDNYITLLSPYRPSPQRGVMVEDRGYWTKDEGLIFHDRLPTSRRRTNLQQTMLKSCLVMTVDDTLNHLEDYRDKHVDAVTKANYPWVLLLVRRMNATINFTRQSTWGYRDKNGSWSGMVGLLDRREIDLGGTATFFTPERIGVVEYVQLYTPTGSKFLFRRPPLSYVTNLFTLPFGRSVWIAIGVFLILVIGLLYLAMKWEHAMKSKDEIAQQNTSSNVDEVPSLSDDLLVVIGAVSQQGSSYEPQAVPARIIVLMLLISALSLYASYTANIVALLQSTATSINTLTDLMNSPLKLGVYDIVYNHYYFQAAQDPERKKFYETAIKGKKGVWMNLEEGVRRIREGLFAFHVEVSAGYQLMQETFEEDEKCGIHEVDYLNVLKPLLIVQKQTPYLEIVRVGALWIHEVGLQYREASRLYPEKPVCHGQNSFLSVGITECYAALMTVAYGVAVTLGVLLLEVIWHKWSSSRTKEEFSNIEFAE